MNYNKERMKWGKRCSVFGIILNLFLFSLKLFASIISGSLASVADAFNNLTDSFASIISLVGFRLSEKNADSDHPYGHARAEYLSALLVSVVIVFIGFEFLKTSIGDIVSPGRLALSPLLFIILALSVILKIIMAVFNHAVGKKINSNTLIATAADSRNDAVMTFGIIAGYLLSYLLHINLDAYISLIISIFILFSGVVLIKSTIDPLLGQAPSKETVSYIKEKILSYPNVLGTHDLIVHDYGSGKVFAAVHVEMPYDLDVMESHGIIDKMEDDFLSNDNIHMIIHFDPIKEGDDLSHLRKSINLIASKIHEDCTIHDLKRDGNNIIFDCVKPEGCPLNDEAVIWSFDVALRLINPEYKVKITIDSGFSPIIN